MGLYPWGVFGVRKMTWKKNLHTHKQSSPWVCPASSDPGQRCNGHQPTEQDWLPLLQKRGDQPAQQGARGCCASAEERESAIEKFSQKGLC